MEESEGMVRSLIEKLKRIRFNDILWVVPPELKDRFDRMQLKNSLYRLKLLGAVTVIFNILNWPIYILRADEISFALFCKIFWGDLSQLLVTVLFFPLTGYFSKRGKISELWFICYAFIALNFIISAYPMMSAEIFLSLQLFFTGTFLYTFVPDFKPKIFISSLVLWYFTFLCILAHNSRTFAVGSPQVLALNIFLIAVIIRIFHYNSKVKTFVNTFRINALNEKLEALSMTDELTKLDNRRSFLERVDLIWKQNHRLNLPVTVMMIDVDYFKKYNDSLGHLEGDKALIAIAQCLKNHVKRETDLIARFGGEEFVCLLPFIEKDEALSFAKALVQKVEDMKIPHPMSSHSQYVTISVGMANTVPNNDNSYTQLLDEADKALYSAKESGRNTVMVSDVNVSP